MSQHKITDWIKDNWDEESINAGKNNTSSISSTDEKPETVDRGCSIKKDFWNILKNLIENSCAVVLFK